jgi:4-hydroxy-3-polyprenylbenzoate decarboxylase
MSHRQVHRSGHPLVVAITGASGVVYGQRLLEVLLKTDIEIHLTISQSGATVLKHETGVELDLEHFRIDDLIPGQSMSDRLRYHHYSDFMTPIASGAFKTRGMVVCPCSGSTLSGIATAASKNLVMRAADVHLKEKRPLILVPRETPLSLIQIENLHKACQAGATILPASPGFYHGHQSVADLVDFVVARILDQLDIEHSLIRRWGSQS